MSDRSSEEADLSVLNNKSPELETSVLDHSFPGQKVPVLSGIEISVLNGPGPDAPMSDNSSPGPDESSQDHSCPTAGMSVLDSPEHTSPVLQHSSPMVPALNPSLPSPEPPALKQKSPEPVGLVPDHRAGCPGEPVHIVSATDDHTFQMDHEALARILLRPDVVDKVVSVISVAGTFRKGKSFLLNFLLRYLKAGGRPEWLKEEQGPLDGFSWRGGSDRETTGILVWSEPFLVTNSRGQEVAVLLMDTQGTFDCESTIKEGATVFAFSTMMSSVQVFNVSQNIQEDDLQRLQLFTEYGRLALEATDYISKPFQSLQFLVRDWSYPYEFPYGAQGGRQILERRLKVSERQHPDLQQVRRHVQSCFDQISCFLMPHPGLKVATDPNFNGHLADIEPDFLQQLEVLVPALVSGENIVVKEVNGQELHGREIFEYFKVYMEIFQGQQLPEPVSMLRATAEATNQAAVSNCKCKYNKLMDQVCGCCQPYVSPNNLQAKHAQSVERCLDLFQSSPKLGGPELSQVFEDKLKQDLTEGYSQYQLLNQSKYDPTRTPLVLAGLLLVGFLSLQFLRLVGLRSLTMLVAAAELLLLLLLVTWVYLSSHQTGAELVLVIDQLADLLLEQIWSRLDSPESAKHVEAHKHKLQQLSDPAQTAQRRKASPTPEVLRAGPETRFTPIQAPRMSRADQAEQMIAPTQHPHLMRLDSVTSTKRSCHALLTSNGGGASTMKAGIQLLQTTDTNLVSPATDTSSQIADASFVSTAIDTSIASRTSDTSVAPHVTDTSISLRTSDTSIAPQASDTSVAPHATYTSIAPRTSDTSIAPHVTDTSVAPHATDTSVSTHTPDSNVAPHAKDTSCNPNASETSLAPRITDASLAHDVTDTIFAPQSTDTSLVDSVKDASLAAQTTETSLSLNVTITSLAPHSTDASIAFTTLLSAQTAQGDHASHPENVRFRSISQITTSNPQVQSLQASQVGPSLDSNQPDQCRNHGEAAQASESSQPEPTTNPRYCSSVDSGQTSIDVEFYLCSTHDTSQTDHSR